MTHKRGNNEKQNKITILSPGSRPPRPAATELPNDVIITIIIIITITMYYNIAIRIRTIIL